MLLGGKSSYCITSYDRSNDQYCFLVGEINEVPRASARMY